MELQREAYQQQTPVSVLLRKAYTLSRKLKVEEFSKWVELELNGYKDAEGLPDYRILHGEIKALNPYHGYIPAYFHIEIEKLIKKKDILSPLTEVELLVKQGEESGRMLMYKFPSHIQMMFMKMTEVEFEVSLHIPVSQFNNILDKVRNIILEWTLKLEEEGVLGEGMTFSEKEKEMAVKSSAPIINHIGTMINSQLQQNTEHSTQSLKLEEFKVESLLSLISSLEKFQEEVQDSVVKQELASEIEVLHSQVKSPNPKRGIIKEALKSVRNIAEGTTGSLVATGILQQVTTILSTLGS
ncbi:hypothetical protein Dred_0995 [Desulforamulus reducens MI-1]|uniref:AbiTii domain-containing protein n=1 Tax=Desulforamulus reducens (strain ATCC BAA-1160 / DSM 100696 / MI-1) TaxID=349161 RepID=A4J377_DESRM|nr:hypothetical protein [Desulforamulus reducens]ABO49530.1 hypothetical protein Dred_0995 [Desulforamulus reducens MI-1]